MLNIIIPIQHYLNVLKQLNQSNKIEQYKNQICYKNFLEYQIKVLRKHIQLDISTPDMIQ
jgi:hypothetical protein